MPGASMSPSQPSGIPATQMEGFSFSPMISDHRPANIGDSRVSLAQWPSDATVAPMAAGPMSPNSMTANEWRGLVELPHLEVADDALWKRFMWFQDWVKKGMHVDKRNQCSISRLY